MSPEAQRFGCLCCGCLTLPERPPGTFNICPVCWWEDDTAQDHHRNRRAGTNRVSLQEAQENYRKMGASEPAYVGFDVLVTDDGRVRNVYGFLDKTPSA